MNYRLNNLVTGVIPLILMAAIGLALPAAVSAQQAENQSAREKIATLMKRAERLQEQGAIERAEQLTKQAQQLKAQLAKGNQRQRPARANQESGEERARILQGLRAGASSLRALGQIEEAKRLQRLAAEFQQKGQAAKPPQGGQNERQVALRQLQTMRVAKQALLDAGREDSAELMERVMHVQELDLEGNRSEKAMADREKAPNLGQRIELLTFAAQNLRDAGKTEAANRVANLGEQMQRRFRAQRQRRRQGQQRETRRADGGKEQQVAEAQIKVMKTALVALREGERKDAADLLNRAIQARVVRLNKSQGEEARVVIQREPKLGQTVRILGQAAKLWREFDNPPNAVAVRKLADELAVKLPASRPQASRQSAKPNLQRAKQQREPASNPPRAGVKPKRPQAAGELQRLKKLEDEVAKLKAALEKQAKALQELRRKDR